LAYQEQLTLAVVEVEVLEDQVLEIIMVVQAVQES
jgi:hypothetical protein